MNPDMHNEQPGAAPETLDPAELEWRQDDQAQEAPYSSRYDDVYFSRQDGREETHFVFLEHNGLPARFGAWAQPRPFVIGETGFGTGLNMLCAWECFEQHAPPEARLHLVSTEKHPLTVEALERVWQGWPTLAAKARALTTQWPEPVPGVHRLRLDDRVTLDLHLGDAAERLAQLDGKVDAWFLDGFAPTKNPDMWQPALFEAIAAASRPGTTFATFTCAGIVKRGLANVGFAWRKVPGFGRKREMLCGECQPTPRPSPCAETPWFEPPRPLMTARATPRVAVIGAGIAGCSVAEALARRGSQVTLIDRTGVAAGASGNAQAALYVKLAATPNLQSRFYLAALLYAQRWLAQLDPQRHLWADCGLLQLASHEREHLRQQRFLDSFALPSSVVAASNSQTITQRCGAGAHFAALDYAKAGWVDPVALCQRLAATPGIDSRQATLEALCQTQNGWRLRLSGGHSEHGDDKDPDQKDEDSKDDSLEVDQVVIAAGYSSHEWLDGLPLQPIRGQISALAGDALPDLDRVLCAEGYVLPPRNGRLTFGATFAPHETDIEVRDTDHQRNLDELVRTTPALASALAGVAPKDLEGRASVRAASPDKTPYAGPLPDVAAWRRTYANLGKDARSRFETPGVHHEGLWVSSAHGSRGMVSAPLCAELIASRIYAEPLPLPRELVDHLHPGRRIIADLIKGRS